VYADQSDWADTTNPFTEAGGFNQRVEWTTLLTDMRMVWAAAWIDGRESLLGANAAVLRVPDPGRRAALRDRLAQVPVTMSDVAAMREERKRRERAEPATLETWKARQRIETADRFRRHHDGVAAAARESAP
jgi:hypothetical protein